MALVTHITEKVPASLPPVGRRSLCAHSLALWGGVRTLQAGPALAGCVPTILAALPRLWEATEGHNIARAPILELVTEVVTALEAESAGLHSALVPLIRTGTDAKNALYLGDTALVLWDAMVRGGSDRVRSLRVWRASGGYPDMAALARCVQLEHVTTYTQAIHEMFPCIIPLMKEPSNAGNVMPVVAQYVLLGGDGFMAAYVVCASVCASVCADGRGC